MRINTNIAAFRTYTNLLSVSTNTETAMARLSSGHKINSVKDDPAGMAVSNKLRSQIRSLAVADRNAMDAISVLQTAEGSLQEVHNMLQKMKELTVQASNDTLTANDRKKIQEELSLLLEEMDDNAKKTEFNGMNLLNGEAARLTEVPAQDKDIVSCVYVSEDVGPGCLLYDIDVVGMPATVTTGTANVPSGLTGRIEINGETLYFAEEDQLDQSAALEQFRELCARNNIEIAIENNGTWADYASGANRAMLFTKESGSAIGIEIEGDDAVLAAFGLTQTAAFGSDAVVSDATLDNTPMHVVTEGNKITLTASDSRTIELRLHPKEAPEPDFTWQMKNGDAADTFSEAGTMLTVTGYGPFTFQIGTDEGMAMTIQIPEVTSESLGLSVINAGTSQGAQRALGLIDEGIDKVSDIRAKLGAYQNRLEYTSLSLATATENTNQSLSRILDTDLALEMTNLTKNNVLSQAGIAILAQANQRPQQMLQLLD